MPKPVRCRFVVQGLAALLAIAVLGIGPQSDAKSPPAGQGAPKLIAPLNPMPTVKARPAPLPPPAKPYTGPVTHPGGLPDGRRMSPTGVPFTSCRSACASFCYNNTSCDSLNVSQCTSARQRCRLSCVSTC